MSSHLFPTYGRWDMEIVEASGTKVIDSYGKTYLDFISGIAVCNLGHCHEGVKQAVQDQLEKVWHVSNLFQNSLQEEVATLLTDNSVLDVAFFCNSGAEANEAAIKLARKHTGRDKIITFKQSFHGRTFATMSATGQEKIHKGFGTLLQEFCYAPYNDSLAFENEMNDKVAAVMLEVVQGEGGVVPAQKKFLKKVEALCKRYGALFIIDEVQTGVGRTGEFFAHTHYDISPDIVTLAKGLGNGFPVGAMLGKRKLMNTLSPGTHGSTFGGNMLAMAAAREVVSIINQPVFLQEVKDKGSYFMQKLNEKLEDLEEVKAVRGLGLMIGIECEHEVGPLIMELQEKGLLVVSAGQNVLRLLPPLTVSVKELDEAVTLITEVFVGKLQLLPSFIQQ